MIPDIWGHRGPFLINKNWSVMICLQCELTLYVGCILGIAGFVGSVRFYADGDKHLPARARDSAKRSGVFYWDFSTIPCCLQLCEEKWTYIYIWVAIRKMFIKSQTACWIFLRPFFFWHSQACRKQTHFSKSIPPAWRWILLQKAVVNNHLRLLRIWATSPALKWNKPFWSTYIANKDTAVRNVLIWSLVSMLPNSSAIWLPGPFLNWHLL